MKNDNALTLKFRGLPISIELHLKSIDKSNVVLEKRHIAFDDEMMLFRREF